ACGKYPGDWPPGPLSTTWLIWTRWLIACANVIRRFVALELRAAAKAELLDAVISLLQQWERIIEPQRAERRCPDEADTDRSTHGGRVCGLQGFAGDAPVGRSLVVPERAGVGEHRTFEPGLLGQEGERRLGF